MGLFKVDGERFTGTALATSDGVEQREEERNRNAQFSREASKTSRTTLFEMLN